MQATTWMALLLCGAALSAPARAAAQQVVGTTHDACDGDDRVRLQGRDKNHSIRANTTENVPLPSFTSEITWYCGDSRERAANGAPFNNVRVRRASNGAITWTFRVVSEAPTAPPAGSASGEAVTNVGSTKDACDGSDRVSLTDARGQQVIRAGEVNRWLRFNDARTEITWFCGSSEERVANDVAFNDVLLTRAANGALSWVFRRREAAATTSHEAPTGLVRVGDTKDACDGSRRVRVPTPDGVVLVDAGQSKLFAVGSVTRQLGWSCFDSNERVANLIAFDWVNLARAGNGALSWIFYRLEPPPVTSPSSNPTAGRYIHNASGRLFLRAMLADGTPQDFPFPIQLRDSLAARWTSTWRARIDSIVRAFSSDTLTVHTVAISDTSMDEFRVMGKDGDAVIKYIIHHNTVEATIHRADPEADPRVRLTFDVEIMAPLFHNLLVPYMRTRAAPARIRYAEVDGTDMHSNSSTALAMVVPRIRAQETALNGIQQSVTRELNAGLDSTFAAVPSGLLLRSFRVTDAGSLALCFVPTRKADCRFRPDEAAPRARRVIDTATERCGESRVWVRDTERDRYIPIAKGGRETIELDSRRFEWFCGGSQAPDLRNEEWATGPRETHAVRITRAASGREVTMEFLHWRERQ